VTRGCDNGPVILPRYGVAAVVLAVAAALPGCTTTVAGSAVRAQNDGPVGIPPLDEDELDDVLLSIGELNGIVGSTDMSVTSDLEEMVDHSEDVSDPDCLGAIYGAEKMVYSGTGWTAVRDQVASEPGDNQHWVEQTAVLYPTSQKAQQFFDDSMSSWEQCAGYSVTIDDGSGSYLWEIADVTAKDTTITQMTAQEGADGWGCQHAVSIASNLTVEAWACGYTVSDEAETMVAEMIANAGRR
jgi:hypothetical protein